MEKKNKNTFYLVMRKPDAYAVFPDDFNVDKLYRYPIVALFGDKTEALEYARTKAYYPERFLPTHDMKKRYNEFKSSDNTEDDYDEEDAMNDNNWAIVNGYM